MTKITTRSDALRAGRLVLAVDADDGAEVGAILREAAAQPAGVLRLLLEMAAVTTSAARAATGDDWQRVLSLAMLDTEADDALIDAAPDVNPGRERVAGPQEGQEGTPPEPPACDDGEA